MRKKIVLSAVLVAVALVVIAAFTVPITVGGDGAISVPVARATSLMSMARKPLTSS